MYMIDRIDRKLLALLQEDCSLSLQALADAVNLTATPCWKRLKKLEEEGVIRAQVALVNPEKLGLTLTAFMFLKTLHHNREWYVDFVQQIKMMPEVLACHRLTGEYDYLLRIQVKDMKCYDNFYKTLVNSIEGLSVVTSSFSMEEIKYTTALPL